MLVYSTIASLDGYTAAAAGKFDWAEPDQEVFAFVNDIERGIGTYLYGRLMYDTMRFWETASPDGQPPAVRDFTGIWRAAEKAWPARRCGRAWSTNTTCSSLQSSWAVARRSSRQGFGPGSS